jgi:hypothetical protein
MRCSIPVYVHLLRAKDVIDRDYSEELDIATLRAPPMPRRPSSSAGQACDAA